jgi:hypothetical protein
MVGVPSTQAVQTRPEHGDMIVSRILVHSSEVHDMTWEIQVYYGNAFS